MNPQNSQNQSQSPMKINSGSYDEDMERVYLQGVLDRTRVMKKNTEKLLELLMTFRTLFDKKKWAIKELEALEKEEGRLLRMLK